MKFSRKVKYNLWILCFWKIVIKVVRDIIYHSDNKTIHFVVTIFKRRKKQVVFPCSVTYMFKCILNVKTLHTCFAKISENAIFAERNMLLAQQLNKNQQLCKLFYSFYPAVSQQLILVMIRGIVEQNPKKLSIFR